MRAASAPPRPSRAAPPARRPSMQHREGCFSPGRRRRSRPTRAAPTGLSCSSPTTTSRARPPQHAGTGRRVPPLVAAGCTADSPAPAAAPGCPPQAEGKLTRSAFRLLPAPRARTMPAVPGPAGAPAASWRARLSEQKADRTLQRRESPGDAVPTPETVRGSPIDCALRDRVRRGAHRLRPKP
jgi:hypothetical protein